MTMPEKIEYVRKLARRIVIGETITASQLEYLARLALEMADEVEKIAAHPCENGNSITI